MRRLVALIAMIVALCVTPAVAARAAMPMIAQATSIDHERHCADMPGETPQEQDRGAHACCMPAVPVANFGFQPVAATPLPMQAAYAPMKQRLATSLNWAAEPPPPRAH